MWQPPNVKALQTVVGSTRAGIAARGSGGGVSDFQRWAGLREAATLRDLLEIRPAGPALALEEVERAGGACASSLSRAR